MQIDFHTSSHQTHSRRQESPSFAVSPLIKRIVAGLCVLIGLIFILFSVLSILTGQSSTPYALLVFSGSQKDSPRSTVTLLWIDEEHGMMRYTSLPGELEFHSQTLGTYPLSSILAAKDTVSESTGDFLTDVSYFFRFPITGYLRTRSDILPSKLSLFRAILPSCFSRTGTTLRFRECIHLSSQMASFSTVLRTQSFPDKALTTGSLDSTQALNRDVYREWSQTHFADSFKVWNKYTVAVLNGTDAPGLATNASKILSDFGLSLLSVGDTTDKKDHGEIVITNALHAHADLVKFLETALRLPSRVDESVTNRYRTDIVVFIGKSEVKFFAP